MKKLFPWLGASLVVLIIFGTIYAAIQQSQRRDANYPQIQMAEDKVVALDNGTQPDKLAQGRVNISRSLAPFTIIYDKSGKPVAGSGYLNNKLPTVPMGVLTASKGKEYSFVTWEPAAGVRIAAVSATADKYYVLSGRSLKEVEKNDNKTLTITLLGYIASLLTMTVVFAAHTGRIKPLKN